MYNYEKLERVNAIFQNEIEEIKKTSKVSSEKRRFQQVTVHVNSCIFITADIPEPLDLSFAIMDNLLETKQVRTRNLIRMVPVHTTCKAYLDDIEKSCTQLINDRFPKHEETTFYVVFKARNNSSLDREIVCKRISNLVCAFNQLAIADYKIPKFVFNIDVVKNMCCLGVLPEYLTKYCKYNLIQLAQSTNTKTENKQVEVT